MKRTLAWILGIGSLAVIGGGLEASSVPAPTGLVAYWKLDELAGSNAIDQIAGNNGQHINVPTIVTTNLPAAIQFQNDACLQFAEASNQAVRVADAPETSLTGDFTLSAWIKPTSLPGHQMGILEKWFWNGSAAESGYMIRMSTGGQISCSIAGPPSNPGAQGGTGATVIPLNVWTHVAATFDSLTGQIQIYVNGSLDGSGSSSELPTDGGGNLEIGCAVGANYFDGYIDDVRIYDCAMLSGDIQQLAAGVDVGGGGGAPPPPPPPPPTPAGPGSNRENDNGDGCSCSTILSRPVSGWLAVFGLGLMLLVRRVTR